MNDHCISTASVCNQKSILPQLDWFICDPQWYESKNPWALCPNHHWLDCECSHSPTCCKPDRTWFLSTGG